VESEAGVRQSWISSGWKQPSRGWIVSIASPDHAWLLGRTVVLRMAVVVFYRSRLNSHVAGEPRRVDLPHALIGGEVTRLSVTKNKNKNSDSTTQSAFSAHAMSHFRRVMYAVGFLSCCPELGLITLERLKWPTLRAPTFDPRSCPRLRGIRHSYPPILLTPARQPSEYLNAV
jgi:hypothetical protein